MQQGHEQSDTSTILKKNFRFSENPLENRVQEIANEAFCIGEIHHSIKNKDELLIHYRKFLGERIDELLEHKGEIIEYFSASKYRFRVRLLAEEVERTEKLNRCLKALGQPTYSSPYGLNGVTDEEADHLSDNKRLTVGEIFAIRMIPSAQLLIRFFDTLADMQKQIATATDSQITGMSHLVSRLCNLRLKDNLHRDGVFSLAGLNRVVNHG